MTSYNVLDQTPFLHDQQNRAISDEVTIEHDVYLGNHITVYPKVWLEHKSVVFDGAVLGRLPLSNNTTTRTIRSSFSELRIGSGTIIGCHAVLYTGSSIGENVLIADLASIREGCTLGDGVVIGRGAMVLYDCVIGAYSRIQDQVHLVGNMIIEDHVFIGMGVMTTNDNDIFRTRFGITPPHFKGPIIRRFAVIGSGATILPGVEIGQGAMVAAGVVVTHNVDPWTVVAGVPARRIKDIPDEWRQAVEHHQEHN